MRRQPVRVRVAVERLQHAGLLLVQAVLVDEGAAEVEDVVHVTDPRRARLLAGVAVGARPDGVLEVGGGPLGRRPADVGAERPPHVLQQVARRERPPRGAAPGTPRGSGRRPRRRRRRASAPGRCRRGRRAGDQLDVFVGLHRRDQVERRRQLRARPRGVVRGHRAGHHKHVREAGPREADDQAEGGGGVQPPEDLVGRDARSVGDAVEQLRRGDQPTKAAAAHSFGCAAMRYASSPKPDERP